MICAVQHRSFAFLWHEKPFLTKSHFLFCVNIHSDRFVSENSRRFYQETKPFSDGYLCVNDVTLIQI
jgi:hypothetical protein